MKNISHAIYMKSNYWKKLSKLILDNPNVKCGICGKPRWSIYKVNTQKHKKGDKRRLLKLQCHHTSYEHMGVKELEILDIIPCCHSCHETGHTLHKLSKRTSAWSKVYDVLLKETSWRYEENIKKEYQVPDNFIIPKTKAKKKKNTT
ncbi:MAG: hypothetical protein PF569_06435 [Candidatus Woesearchaeota archaeon]|jgi:hypothetical protein|nr:hypothetical protein [Candidatus Woesearchaeota archaeon]